MITSINTQLNDSTVFKNNTEVMDSLDAYGHLNYSVCEEYEEDDIESDISICADFRVIVTDDRKIFVAYHVIHDDDYAACIDVVDSGIFPIEELGDLGSNDWFPIMELVDSVNENLAHPTEKWEEFKCIGIGWEQVEEVQKRWSADLMGCVKRAIAWVEAATLLTPA